MDGDRSPLDKHCFHTYSSTFDPDSVMKIILYKFYKTKPTRHKLCGIKFFGENGLILESGECENGSKYDYEVREGERIIGVHST